MITKGIILKITSSAEQGVVFQIRLPIFETANELSDFVLDAHLCYQPGNLEGYSIGDVVYVGFENEVLRKPVILGKLYKGSEKQLFQEYTNTLTEEEVTKRNATNFSYNASLEVVHDAVLPNNTKIGDLTYDNIYGMYKTIEQLKNRLEQVENQLNLVYEEQIPAIQRAADSITVADLESLSATPDGSSE